MRTHGPVHTSFDFDTPGKRNGFIDLTHSDHRHAFSAVRVPVGVIQGGAGPTVMLTAGNHGDEYEGQVILHQLMQQLSPDQVQGRLIFLPALNTPAVLDRARVSPLDGGNMNRSFPGATNAGPTKAIAAFVDAHLIPMADAILDFHSGGTTAEYVDCGFLCVGPDAVQNAANLELAEVFGAPFTMVATIDGTGGDFDTAAYNQNTRFLSCELGGMGRFSQASFQTGWAATNRVLTHLGLIDNPSEGLTTRFIDVGAGCSFGTTGHHGLAQLHVSPGDEVRQGDHVGTVFDVHNFGAPPERVLAGQNGVVAVCRRNPLVEPGDHLCMVTREIPVSEMHK
ncbi:succinylglutamate desuccinylase/aspartoacylase family protein [Cochlodiniinecator piscidefendens]|uniref:succinylglutamate desuccinylase/aspartoacylase family protein n=1 Tax=Cochlodiniinecator piscidefendens TaxID=2715756 RepID=UPI00140AD660|nr:succinylglutamate desuccinylase/aspartoacylase family protein [Cochlodiniinecator piscidefendens]